MEIHNMTLISRRPGETWPQAFPLGNGQIGAMVYGSVPENRITLSENTFFSGKKEEHQNQEGAAKAFYEMRKLAEENDFESVHKVAERFIGRRGNYGTNLPVGNILLDYGVSNQKVNLEQRSLDIMSGVSKRTIMIQQEDKDCIQGMNPSEENRIEETIYASNADHVLVISIHGDQFFSLDIKLENHTEGSVSYQETNHTGKIVMKEYAYETMHCDEKCGVCLEAEMIIETDGRITACKDHLEVENAKEVNAYLRMKTDFQEKSMFHSDYEHRRSEFFLDRHIKDFQPKMERCMLKLDSKESSNAEDMFLFQYGRYLLLSSSREDSLLPTHLQGIWNDNVACRIGWTCDMHLDINTQMNYWPSEVTNLSECNEPLFRYIREMLAPMGAITAKECYGLPGWVGELVSNAWGYASPYWASPLSPCPTGGVWILTHMWEHYLYTEDREFLSEIAFPLIKSATEFFSQYVFVDTKLSTKKNQSDFEPLWTCGPSISPENSFGSMRQYQISNGCTYELTMIRELFEIYLSASKIIMDTNNQLYEIVNKINLIPFQVKEDGTIAEYQHNEVIPDSQHRHTSHLLGLFPFAQMNMEDTPELCMAAEQTIQKKINPIENWEDTGWASSMLLLYEARLCHSEEAYEHLSRMKHKLQEENKMIYHPPTRGAASFAPVYELDGNTGITSGMAEMLMQSHNGIIRLLPALPKEWKNGSIKGLKARGNITVNMEWENGELVRAEFLTNQEKQIKVMVKNKVIDLSLEEGKVNLLM